MDAELIAAYQALEDVQNQDLYGKKIYVFCRQPGCIEKTVEDLSYWRPEGLQ
jgi:hypothetical protein